MTKLSIAMIDGIYQIETVTNGKLNIIAENIKTSAEAVKSAKQYLLDNGAERGDRVIEVYGTIHEWIGKGWKAIRPSNW